MRDLTGQIYGRLTVIEFAGRNKHSHVKWLVRCECGTEKTVLSQHLFDGNTLSCGCKAKDNNYKHGEAVNGKETNLYLRWCSMNSRCYTKSTKGYCNYGGRGIRVCDDWRHNYKTFRTWALANGYSKELELDRIDPDGNYEPGNCRFITKSENVSRTHAKN